MTETFKIWRPEAIRARILDYANRPTPTEFSRGAQGAIIGRFHDALKALPGMGDVPPADWPEDDVKAWKYQAEIARDNSRYMVFGWLLGAADQPYHPMRSADLTPQGWHALSRWQTEQRGGEWVERPAWRSELSWILTRARWDLANVESNPSTTLGQSMAEWDKAVGYLPESFELTAETTSQVGTALKLGGVVTAQLDEPVSGNGGDMMWCPYCGQRPGTADAPCKSCRELGTYPEMLPDKAGASQTETSDKLDMVDFDF